MNITALRPRLVRHLEPLATLFCRAGITPNQVSLLSLLAGVLCAVCYVYQLFIAGSLLLFISAILDLVDGSVARQTEKETRFGAVFDWIVDKYATDDSTRALMQQVYAQQDAKTAQEAYTRSLKSAQTRYAAAATADRKSVV